MLAEIIGIGDELLYGLPVFADIHTDPASTVIVGLGMLYFSSFAKIQYTGPAIALSLAVALLAALTLAPILLGLLRGAIFWPFRPPHHVDRGDHQRRLCAIFPE